MRKAERERDPWRVPARGRGFTLMELMFTLLVAGLLLTVGVPSYMDLVRNNRATTHANELVGAISIARSEAIRRGARVTLCHSSDLKTCGGTWTDGWIVVADGAATDLAAPVENEVLRVWASPVGNAAMTVTPAGVDWIRFLPRGTVRAEGGVPMPVQFDVTIAGCTGEQARRVEVNLLGRPAVTRRACP